jgi:SAM-dependent methyltransferase
VSADDALGYITDASYPDRFHRELSPAWLNYVAVLNGAAPHDLGEPFDYLELGCAFGHSTMTNAAAFPSARFHGCDINAQHIDGARLIARALDIGNVEFYRASFQELAARDLPSFDFIALHGVYSWVDADARAAIRRVVADCLKPGGLLYVSYNCMPGWSSEVPLRRLLIELAATAAGDSAERSRAAAEALLQLEQRKGRYFTANPEAQSAVEAYAKEPSDYLAHEFLNRAWEPFYSIDVADAFAQIGVRPIGSATLADNHEPLLVDEGLAEVLRGLPALRQRELALDFAVNRRFRRDVFVRGTAEGGATESTSRIAELPIGNVGDPSEIGTVARVPRGEIHFQASFIGELRALLDAGPVTVGQAVTALGGVGRDPAEIARNLLYLVAAGSLSPFARAFSVSSTSAPRGFATVTVERVLAHIVATGAARAVPSAVLGNGISIAPRDAAAIIALVAGGEKRSNVQRLATTLRRLAILV